MRRQSARLLVLFLVLFVVAALVALRAVDARISDKAVIRKLERRGVEAAVRSLQTEHGNLRMIQSGAIHGKPLVFIHGTPGSSRDFTRYLADTLLGRKYRLYAVDRPGYGYSGYGVPEPFIREQAARLADILPDDAIVVGHSYGGAVASALAMYHPSKVDALVLLAAAVQPGAEKPMPWNALVDHRAGRWWVSGAIRVALAERNAHEASLRELLPDWGRIQAPVWVVHGRGDRIIPYSNASFLEVVLRRQIVRVEMPPRMGHLLIWRNYRYVRDMLLDLKSEIPGNSPGSQ